MLLSLVTEEHEVCVLQNVTEQTNYVFVYNTSHNLNKPFPYLFLEATFTRGLGNPCPSRFIVGLYNAQCTCTVHLCQFVDHWTLSHGSCFCRIEGRLLQLHRRESQTSCKCCSTSDHCDSEVRASSVTADDLHWLIVPHRLQYKLAVTVHRCLEHRASRYLADRLLCACVWSSQSAASTICQASSTLCSTSSLQHVWKLCFLCCLCC